MGVVAAGERAETPGPTGFRISDVPKTVLLHGLWTAHDEARSRGAEMMELLGRVWAEVREREIATTGINHAVYGCGDIVFSGLELLPGQDLPSGLVERSFTFVRYAWCRHVGPVGAIGTTYAAMHGAIRDAGYAETCPSMEIYGHWTPDESRFETEIFISLQ